MKIKEQTRKLAAGCSKQCFEVVDRTDKVSNHIYGKVKLTWFEFDFRRVLIVEKLVRNLLLTFFFCKMTKIINFLTNMLVKKKKMCYNKFKLRNRKQKGAMMWVVFILFMIFFYSNNSKKIKKLENKIKKLERKEKGNIEMSRLLQELIGKNPTIVGQVFGTSLWEVVDVDEEWVKLRRVDKKGKEKFKLQRIEDIQTVEFDGE